MAKERIALKPDAAQIPRKYLDIRDRLIPYAAECIPISTACKAEGLNYKKWMEWCARFPALTQELEKAAALCLIEWQRKAMKGGQGWQAYFTGLERLDGANFNKSQAARVQTAKNPLSRAMSRGKK